METSPAVSPKRAVADSLGLGCAIGLLHAMAETTLLVSNDIRPAALDIAIIAAVSAAAAIVIAIAAALVLLTPPLRKRFGAARERCTFRNAIWGLVIAGYALVYLRIPYYQFGWSGALLWGLPALPALAIGGFAVFRKGHRPLVLVFSAALVATTLCALQLFSAEWGQQPASATAFATTLLTPIGVCLLVLAAVAGRTPAGSPFEPLGRAAAPLALLVAAWIGLLATLSGAVSPGRIFGSGTSAPNAARPNVLLVVLDTVRADHLDLFGYHRETMPNLRRFALEECQTSNRAFTPGSWTLPSHASMFTGLYPSAHGAHYPFVGEDKPAFLASSMREDVPTLAEFLGSLGYQTGGIVANFGVLSQFGVSRGFEDYVADPGPAYFAPRILWFYRLRIHEWSLGEFLRGLLPGSLQGHGKMFSVREPDTRRAHEINARTRQWLDQHGSRPFFLFLNYMDAHDPYLPIPEDDERFMQRPAGDEWFGFPMERLAESKRGAATFSATEIEFLQAQYDAELVSLDREVGRLLEYLKEAGLYENTLILVTTDHGEAFFERGFPDHGNSLYQPEVGGFLLIKTPSSMGPVEVSPMMQAVDFFPSVAAMLNEPIPADVQGRPWGAGRDYALSEVFCKSCGREVFEPGWPDAMRHDLVGMVSGGRKLIRSTRGPDEVYDLTADPGELHPMSEVDTEFLRLADAVIAERNKRLVETLSVNPDDKTLIEKLRSLGYIQ